MAQNNLTPEDRFIRPSEIQSITGLSKTTVWRLEGKKAFPRRHQISPGAVGWRLSEVLNWMETRQQA